jgi:hypothetical protein
MVYLSEFKDILINLGGQYFVKDLQFVPDIMSWAKEKNKDLGEPCSPMKLVAGPENKLTMVVQKEVSDEMLNNIIKNLSVRWSLRDNVTDIDNKLDNTKKRLAFCYLKERARSMKDVGGDEQVEDQWVIDEMEALDFFKE